MILVSEHYRDWRVRCKDGSGNWPGSAGRLVKDHRFIDDKAGFLVEVPFCE